MRTTQQTVKPTICLGKILPWFIIIAVILILRIRTNESVFMFTIKVMSTVIGTFLWSMSLMVLKENLGVTWLLSDNQDHFSLLDWIKFLIPAYFLIWLFWIK